MPDYGKDCPYGQEGIVLGLSLSNSDFEQVTSRMLSAVTCKITAPESDCLLLNIDSNYSEVLDKFSGSQVLPL